MFGKSHNNCVKKEETRLRKVRNSSSVANMVERQKLKDHEPEDSYQKNCKESRSKELGDGDPLWDNFKAMGTMKIRKVIKILCRLP